MDETTDDPEVDPIKALASGIALDTRELSDTSKKIAHRTNVRLLVRPFDPMGADAEEQYDDVVRRLNRARARRAMLEGERRELERQFVDDELVVRSGARRGHPLSASGRRKRLNRLIELSLQDDRLREEEGFAQESLGRMNEALDRWARETYGA